MKRTDIVVAGHICLDILPSFETSQRIEPGKLIKIGPAKFATGGAVANTGIALHRLGAAVQLVGRIGDDSFGREIRASLENERADLSRAIAVRADATTSYSIVISPPGVDRSFLHCSGENDRFESADLNGVDWSRAAMFHFGYPPMMGRMFENGGRELAALFELARSHGVITSLDMCMPDEKCASGKANWKQICRNVLPGVDLFCPSIEELTFMLDRPRYREWNGNGFNLARDVDGELLAELSDRCLEMGAGAVMIKLGDQGLYLRTAAETVFAHRAPAWAGRELYCPCRKVRVIGTTGSGDCTIAGFLLAALRGKGPLEALQWSTAVGATCCEAPDATGAITRWNTIQKRMDQGWPWLGSKLKLGGWKKSGALKIGPQDASRSA